MMNEDYLLNKRVLLVDDEQELFRYGVVDFD